LYNSRAYTFLPELGIFKIDTINDENYNEILRHVAYLLLSSDIGFVMKDWKENTYSLQSYLASDKEMIMAFTRERLLAPSEIFSIQGTWDRDVRDSFQNDVNIQDVFNVYSLDVTSYSHSADLYEYLKSHKWADNWEFPFVITGLFGDYTYIHTQGEFMVHTKSLSDYMRQLLN